MNDAPSPLAPIPVGERPSEEDHQLAALFQRMEHEQLTFLDEAGKRIAELCATLLGVLFAVLALGGSFPPPLLTALPWARPLTLIILALLFLALVIAIWAIHPHNYRRYRHNLTQMQHELERMTGFKSRWVGVAGVLFVLGCLGLAVLVGMVVWGAQSSSITP
jgi:hypothetical protein